MSKFVYDETSAKSWEDQAGEYNAALLKEQKSLPREKTQIEVMQETLDMVVLSTLGGDRNV